LQNKKSIATKNAEAQKFFDQGLILNFGFNHDEAVRSFRRAIELDPDAAMAYWGVAWTLGPRYAYVSLTPGSDIFLDVDVERERAAYQAVQEAMAMRSRAPENERRYIEALGKRYSGDANPNRKKLLSDYKDTMARLVRQFPDDLDAQVLYAESLMLRRPWHFGRPMELLRKDNDADPLGPSRHGSISVQKGSLFAARFAGNIIALVSIRQIHTADRREILDCLSYIMVYI
jgi:hypothetical protein